MKKVININFQGRVIPIEEAAYEMLTKYVESLRLFFATEEGKDEIINDIEGRIAELFGESLKKGSTCITESDVNTVINSMGRPEDFDADEEKVHSKLGGENTGHQSSYTYDRFTENRRLYRDENHKVVAGVCSGVANYFGIDPVVIRIIVLVTLGVTLIPYLILWVAVPSSASTVIGSQRKRLFRDPDNKIVAGVCSGLSQYFAINIWIPRVLFLIPFFSLAFRFNHWGWWNFPQLLSLSFSPGSIVVYIILWLVLPEAKSAADKLEMKGEKVDLNNIKTTIQSDLEGFKDRAQQFGTEIKEKAQQFGSTFKSKDPNVHSATEEVNDLKRNATAGFSAAAGSRYSTENEPTMRRNRRGLGDFIALIAKIFAYFILGVVLFSVVVSLFSVGVVFTSFLPAKEYIIRDGWQNIFAWGTLILFIWVPVIGIVTWIIRRLAKKRGNSSFIRATFVSLWLAGVFCLIGLISSLVRDFRYKNTAMEQNIPLSNPKVDKLEVRIAPFNNYYGRRWLRLEPFASVDDDTVFARNIRLRIIKSNKDSFQVTMVKLTNGRTKQQAELSAERMNFQIKQQDTTLLLDKGIAITPQDKFRNQQIIVTVAVPVGKRIIIKEANGWGSWGNSMNVHLGTDADDYNDWESSMESQAYSWRHNVEYVMTRTGLERVDRLKDEDDNDDNNSNETIEQFRKSKEQMQREKEQKLKELQQIDKELQNADSIRIDSSRYHYRSTTPGSPAILPADPKKIKATEKSVATATVPGISDMLMIKFAL